MVFFSSCMSVKYHYELLNYIDLPVLAIHVSELVEKRGKPGMTPSEHRSVWLQKMSGLHGSENSCDCLRIRWWEAFRALRHLRVCRRLMVVRCFLSAVVTGKVPVCWQSPSPHFYMLLESHKDVKEEGEKGMSRSGRGQEGNGVGVSRVLHTEVL